MLEYSGWKNYETWNVALWIDNDKSLHNMAKRYRRRGYKDFVKALREELGMFETPDEVSFSDSGLDIKALDDLLAEL